MRRFPLIASLALAAAIATAGSAAAATPDLSCRASAARVAGLGPLAAVVSEPVRANVPTNPCSSQSASTLDRTTIGPITADAVGAFTAREGNGAASLASISQPKVELPGLVVEVAAVVAGAASVCNGTAATTAGSSKVVNLVMNGSAIKIPSEDAFFELDLSPVARIALNEQVVEGTMLTQRAVHITTSVADVVLAEAIAGVGAGGCSSGDGGGGGGGTGTTPNACPPGSNYDPARNVCIIPATGSPSTTGSGNGSTIVIGRPFEGPSGGSVLGLEAAKRKYKSPCLRSRGSRYVIVGTNGKDSITGTNASDRILLLAGRDRAEGGRGNDCIDGGSGVDTMSGALGADRLYGRSGNDHLIGGSHSDRLYAGPGNDTVNTGFGKDRVSGGAGHDRINAATAGKGALRINCGRGRDKLRINRNERERVRGCERVYVSR